MTQLLAFRLSLQNLWRSKQTYGPFLLASSLLTFALYSLTMLATAPTINDRMGATGNALTSTMLWLGVIVVGIFTAIFMIYADSFVIRRRKKELGLYAVLGMERRHLMWVQLYETLLCYGLTLGVGLGLGMLLARLLFLILRALTHLQIAVSGAPSLPALALVALLMGALFLIILARHALEVVRIRPIELLHASQKAEREPKARWLLALLGAACLVAGYVLAFIVNNPADALVMFFVAVLLVIVGTYLVFITTSIAILKAMKLRKSFYYTPKHFVTVSGMLYRMKQNAAGLASIAILSTMAMVTIGTTASLYLGVERTLEKSYPMDVCYELRTREEQQEVAQSIRAWLDENQVGYKDFHTLSKYTGIVCYDGNGSFLNTDNPMLGATVPSGDYYSNIYVLTLLSLSEYNAYTGGSLTLAPDEMAWCGYHPGDTATFDGRTWKLTDMDPPAISPVTDSTEYLNHAALVVVPTEDDLLSLATFIASKTSSVQFIDYCVRFDWDGGTTQERIANQERMNQEAFLPAMKRLHPEGGMGYRAAFKESTRDGFYALYGAFVFIGLFLGLIFLSGTLLIIYFKQLSEGYQDHDRYIILQKVGMNQQEVRNTVRRQVLLVFMAPLAVALCHVAGSLKMITLMLRMFGLSDAAFISLCSMGAVVVVVAAYLIFYHRTARTYYKLVQFTSASGGK